MARETVDNCEEEHDPHEQHVILTLSEGKLSECEVGEGAGIFLIIIPVIERNKDRQITQRNYTS